MCIRDRIGTFEDSLCAVTLAGLMHDLGMMIGRQGHEEMSVILAKPIIERALMEVFPHDLHRRVIIRSVVIEAIIGHMSSRKIHSTEAGIILIADGCDMTKGRARIPLSINTTPRVGDIHKYSCLLYTSITMAADTSYRYRYNETHRYQTSQIGVFQYGDKTLEVHEFKQFEI